MMSPSKTPTRYSAQHDDLNPLLERGGTRQRRIGGDQPFRDDPHSPGQSMPQHFPPEATFQKKGDLPLAQRLSTACATCLGYGHHGTTNDDAYHYRDNFNDHPSSCHLGTTEEHGIWMNQSDQAGTIMACMVWLLMLYSALTMTLLARAGGIPVVLSMEYAILVALALACHAKTSLTDPGAVPTSAVPSELQRLQQDKLSMCSQCQTFKPPFSHHCRICNRCISRMDHHCPWMNNCIGAGNMKHFFLFLCYTWTCSVFALILLGWNYFFCAEDACMFNLVLLQLVRVMTCLSLGAFLFTSSMLMNVCYGLMTGIGTIDRLKKKATNTMIESDEEPVPLKNVFGIGPWWTWAFPTDPLFEDYDTVMGFSTPQRLLREQMKENPNQATSDFYTPSVGGNSYMPV